MKLRKYLLLPLVALTLVGCGTETSDDPDTGTTTEPDTGTTTDPDTGTTTEPDTGTTDPDTGGDSDPEPVVTKSLEITSLPTKTTYNVNETVDYTGLLVQKVDKTDGVETSSVTVDSTDLSFSIPEGTQLTEASEALEVTVSLLDDSENEYGSVSFNLVVNAIQTVTVTFMNDSTVIDTVEIEAGSTTTYDGTTPTKSASGENSYHFVGWYVEGDDDQTIIDLETYTFNEDTTLIASFKETPTTTTVSPLTYTYDSSVSGYCVSGYDSTSGIYEVVVADDIDGVPVVQINMATSGHFRSNSDITSITLGANVKTIASRAFQGMTNENLKITLNEGLETINSYAFYQNTGIKEITIPSSVTTIATSGSNYVFQAASNLETVIWNTTAVTSIGIYMFYGTSSLKTFTLGEGATITEIGNYAFCQSGLESTPFDMSNVTSIGTQAFYRCESLASFNLPTNSEFTQLPAACFRSSGLTEITIPSNVSSFLSGPFIECTSLTKVTIENPNLSLYTVSSGVSAAFYGCPITEVVFNGTEEQSRAVLEAENDSGVNQFFGTTEVTVEVQCTDGNWTYSYSASE